MRPSHTRSTASIIACLLILPLLSTSCAAKKAYKRALAFEESGQYFESANRDLESLDRRPDFDEAKTHLRGIAELAYTELIDRAAGFERENEWNRAIDTYDRTENFARRCGRHGVTVQASDVGHLRADAVRRGTEYHYGNAESRYSRHEYELAIPEYLKVVEIADYHADTKARLWRCHVEVGNQLVTAGAYQQAISDWYNRAMPYTEFATDQSATRNFIAEAYYQWAERLASDGDPRASYQRFEQVLETVPGYRDAEARAAEMYEEAVARVAVLPFRNTTSLGSQYSNLLTERLISQCVNAELEFAIFATRDVIDQLLSEHELSALGVVDPETATRIGELEGIDYFISGSVTQISTQTGRPNFQEREHKIRYMGRDTTGTEVEMTRSVFYREYTMRRTVEVAATYQIVDVDTGRIIRSEDFSDQVTDEARWIRFQGPINDLPREKRSLLDAPTEPRTADMITNDAIRSISRQMGDKIIAWFR